MNEFLKNDNNPEVITNFCTTKSVQWKFTLECAPHFGGLWEVAVKSMKVHFKRIVGEVKLNFEELTTLLTEI